MKKIIALAALAALSATASAAGNLFTDGSFEQLSSGSGWKIDTGPAGVLGDGWTVGLAPSTSTRGLPVGLEVRHSGVAGTAEDGIHFVELDGNQNDKISQTFATVANRSYEITFFYADRPDQSQAFLKGTPKKGNTPAVQGSGGFAYQVTGGEVNTYSGGLGTDWNEAVIDFVAKGTSTTFSIWAAGRSDSLGTSFDDFSAAAVVPEPATLGLFAAGLAVLGLSSRRRRQQ